MVLVLILACSGTRANDGDQDGWFAVVDCNDDDPAVNPGMPEIPGDGINNDCNLATRDDDYDQDGFLGLDDCDDDNPDIPKPERPYDGLDNDCDPATPDDDLDGDGAGIEDDCDDDDPDVGPGVDEIPYDGIDNDCDPLTSDEDADGDGVLPPQDCDDDNPDVTGPTTWYADCDGDGFARQNAPTVFACRPQEASCNGTGTWTSVEPTGIPSSSANDRIDCADLDPDVYPGQTNFFDVGTTAGLRRYDYDCDGVEEPEYGSYTCFRVPGSSICTAQPGFLVPLGCGQQAEFADACMLVPGTCDADATTLAYLRCR